MENSKWTLFQEAKECFCWVHSNFFQIHPFSKCARVLFDGNVSDNFSTNLLTTCLFYSHTQRASVRCDSFYNHLTNRMEAFLCQMNCFFSTQLQVLIFSLDCILLHYGCCFYIVLLRNYKSAFYNSARVLSTYPFWIELFKLFLWYMALNVRWSGGGGGGDDFSMRSILLNDSIIFKSHSTKIGSFDWLWRGENGPNEN